MDKSICREKSCRNFGKYCRIPGHSPGIEPKKIVPIAKFSPKRLETNKEYAAVSKPLWQGKPCAIHSPNCTGQAQGWNHHAGKENKEKLMDMENGEPACNACNTYVEDHHAWAVEKGFRTKRNTATNRYKNTYQRGTQDQGANDTGTPAKGKKPTGVGKKRKAAKKSSKSKPRRNDH